MTKSKNTKRALIVSALCLLLCVSMLVGTTFAWFTDNASTSVNKIQAGTLDVDIVNSDGKSIAGQSMEFVDKDKNDLWEPGCTYALRKTAIMNRGNLWLKFKLTINGITGDAAKLAEVIEVYNGTYTAGNKDNYLGTLADLMNDADGAAHGVLEPGALSEFYQLSLHMRESAGNEYQGLNLDSISFTVLATQYTAEKDSYDDQYDANAEYAYPAASTATIQELINQSAATGKPVTIVLSEDIVLEAVLNFPAGADVTLDMNGKKMTAKDSSIDPFMDMNAGSALVITGNGTIDLEDNYIVNVIVPRGDVTIENGNFLKNRTGSTPADQIGPMFQGINGGKGVLTINGGYFDGGYYTDGDCFENCRKNVNLSWGQVVKVYGGTFVGQNPAWGDEGMAYLCDQCQHTSGYCQGTFLVGQDWHDTEMPAGYTITEGTTSDGRPTYTVTYTGTR